MKIADREIGPEFPPFIVAEIGANHGGELKRAFELIDAAKDAGADAVKFQFYDPVMLANVRGGCSKEVEWNGEKLTLFELYRRGHTPENWFASLFRYAKNTGIIAFASVFDSFGIGYLQKIDCPAYKISSFEIRDLALIKKAASTRKPLIISIGMASEEEISAAKHAAAGCDKAVLHCVSSYPCPVGAANLRQVRDMRRDSVWPTGFSDHTLGNEAAICAVALGGCIIEKHLTLDRNDGALDSFFSTEPDEFKALVTSCKNAWAACQPSDSLEPYKELRHG